MGAIVLPTWTRASLPRHRNVAAGEKREKLKEERRRISEKKKRRIMRGGGEERLEKGKKAMVKERLGISTM